MAFSLPSLPYAYDALSPHIDAKTMEIHHTKHHQAYIDKLNTALEGHADLAALSIEALLKRAESLTDPLKTAVINHGGGHANHSFFWQLLTPHAPEGPTGKLLDALDDKFDNLDMFKEEFANAATARFGSGWAWLVVNKDKALEIYSTPNQHSPLMEGDVPVLGLDVWEHAYYLTYQNRRPDYIKAFWNVVNWEQAEANFEKTLTNT